MQLPGPNDAMLTQQNTDDDAQQQERLFLQSSLCIVLLCSGSPTDDLPLDASNDGLVIETDSDTTEPAREAVLSPGTQAADALSNMTMSAEEPSSSEHLLGHGE